MVAIGAANVPVPGAPSLSCPSNWRLADISLVWGRQAADSGADQQDTQQLTTGSASHQLMWIPPLGISSMALPITSTSGANGTPSLMAEALSFVATFLLRTDLRLGQKRNSLGVGTPRSSGVHASVVPRVIEIERGVR